MITVVLCGVAVAFAIFSVISTCFVCYLLREQRAAEKVDHLKCAGMMAAFVGDKFAASVLDAAADHFETSEGQADLIRARLKWVVDGESIPAIWLRDRAEQMRAKEERYVAARD